MRKREELWGRECVQSQIALWSLERMRPLCMRTAQQSRSQSPRALLGQHQDKASGLWERDWRHRHRTWNFQKLSSRKGSSDSMISRAMKSHTNEHIVRGRSTLKVVKPFRNGSVCKAYERSIYERTFWVNLSRIMLIPKELLTGA